VRRRRRRIKMRRRSSRKVGERGGKEHSRAMSFSLF